MCHPSHILCCWYQTEMSCHCRCLPWPISWWTHWRTHLHSTTSPPVHGRDCISKHTQHNDHCTAYLALLSPSWLPAHERCESPGCVAASSRQTNNCDGLLCPGILTNFTSCLFSTSFNKHHTLFLSRRSTHLRSMPLKCFSSHLNNSCTSITAWMQQATQDS